MVAAVLVLLVGGGAFAAYQFLGGGGPQPADALPGTAVAYTRIDLDPSASQKVAVLRLLRRLPNFTAQTGISSDREDLRARIVESFLAGSPACQQLSYQRDFAPWVGNRAAVAVVPVAGVPQPVVAIQVRDESAARQAVAALRSCSGLAGGTGSSAAAASTADSGVEFVGGYLLVAKTADLAKQFAHQAESSPLSAQSGFRQDMSRLGDQGVASFWVDVDALSQLPQLSGGLQAQQAMGALKATHSITGAFRAGSDYLELVLQSDSDLALGGETHNRVVDLPGSTLAAVSVSNGSQYVDQGWGQLQSLLDQAQPGALAQQVTAIEQATGLVLPDDLRTILGDNVTFAVDSAGLTPSAVVARDLSSIGAGIRFTSDPNALQGVLDRVRAKAAAAGVPFPLTVKQTADGLVLATNQAYADTLAANGDLGDSSTFSQAVPDAATASNVVYVDLDKAYDVVSAFAATGSSDSGSQSGPLGVLAPMKAFGASVRQSDGYTSATLRLTFN